MKRLSNLLAWGAVAIVAALAVLNWSTLMASAPLDLVVAQIQAPLGVVMLGLAAVLVALFFVATMRNQIGSLLETRRLLQEIQRVQNLADKAEASRIENLHQLIATEFRLLNERLNERPNAAPQPLDLDPTAAVEPTGDGKEFKPLSLTEIVTGHEKR